MGVYPIGLCVSRVEAERIYSTEIKKIGIEARRRILQTHIALEKKIRERKGPSRGVIQNREPHERSPCAPKFEERSREISSQQERCACKAAKDLAKNDSKLTKCRQCHVLLLLLKLGQRWRPLQTYQRKENSWLNPELQWTCWAKEIWGILWGDPETLAVVITANGRSANK